MKATSKILARIAFLLVAVALLAGIGARSVGAQPIDIDSGPATIARALCTASGGSWNITNNIFFCTGGDGSGWACDMDTNPIVCWNFPAPQAGIVKGAIGHTQIGNAQVHPTTAATTGTAVIVQAKIASAQLAPATGATKVTAQTATHASVQAVSVSNP